MNFLPIWCFQLISDHEALLHRRYDIFMDEGYDIMVKVYDREELAARMKSSARAA